MSGERGYEGRWSSGDDSMSRSKDPALRHLRRRYESLRDDYEELIERLAQVESRLEPGQPRAAPRGAPGQEARHSTPPAGSGSVSEQVLRAIAAPWFALRDEYSRAAQELLGIVHSMDELADRAFKGQRPAHEEPPSPAAPPPPPPPPAREEAPEPSAASQEEPTAEEIRAHQVPPSNGAPDRTTIQVQVQSPNLGALLDFQEHLSQLPDVARVSMSQVNEERAVLVVELRPDSSGQHPG